MKDHDDPALRILLSRVTVPRQGPACQARGGRRGGSGWRCSQHAVTTGRGPAAAGAGRARRRGSPGEGRGTPRPAPCVRLAPELRRTTVPPAVRAWIGRARGGRGRRDGRGRGRWRAGGAHVHAVGAGGRGVAHGDAGLPTGTHPPRLPSRQRAVGPGPVYRHRRLARGLPRPGGMRCSPLPVRVDPASRHWRGRRLPGTHRQTACVCRKALETHLEAEDRLETPLRSPTGLVPVRPRRSTLLRQR